MSESAVSAVYLVMASMFFAIACWKALVFAREPTPTLALMTVSFFIGGAIYVMASPMGYQWLGSAFGQPWIATLPIYLGILMCYGKMHLLTVVWTPTRQDTPQHGVRTVTAWAVLYCVALMVMIFTFMSADLEGPADPLRFNTEQADDPWVLVFLTVFLITLTSGTLNTWRRCRKAAHQDEWVGHALLWFGRSMVVTFGYVVCSVPAILAAATGHHQLDDVGVLGAGFGMLGCIGTCYGLSGAAISAWLRERRDIALLTPLWELVVADVNAELSFGAIRRRHQDSPGQDRRDEHSVDEEAHVLGPGRLVNVRWTLLRMIIEILDGIRVLRQWIGDEPARVLREVHHQSLADGAARARLRLGPGGLSPQELEAAVSAAVLRHAAAQLRSGRRESDGSSKDASPLPGQPAVAVPGAGTAAAEERTRLVRIARMLTHPLVDASLELVAANQDNYQAGREAEQAR